MIKKIENMNINFKIGAVILLIPAIVYIMIVFPFPPAFNTSRDGWLSFFGGYVGGISTLIAVVLTLRENSKKEIDKMRLSIKPFIVGKFKYEYTDEEKKISEKYLVIKNVGIGPAINFKLPDDFKPYGGLLVTTDYIFNIAAGEEIKIAFRWKDNNHKNKDLDFSHDITYTDVSMETKYIQNLEISKKDSKTHNYVMFGKQAYETIK